METEEKIVEMRRILTEELADDNYFILKYVVHFLTEVFMTDNWWHSVYCLVSCYSIQNNEMKKKRTAAK